MPSAAFIDAWDEVTMPDPDQSTFQRLVKDLSDVLGPSSGLSSADVDVGTIIKLMEDYISDEPNWTKYAFEDANKAFTRNLVDRGNGKSNLVCLRMVCSENRVQVLTADVNSFSWSGLLAKKPRFIAMQNHIV